MAKIRILPVFLFCCLSCFAQESEYQLKALFFEQFSRFIEWPASMDVQDTSKPFHISVLGKNPFGTLLHDTYKGQTIRNKRVRISYPATPADIDTCHMLFISSSLSNNIQQIIDQIKDKPIFTIGDTPGYAEAGVHLNMFQQNNTLKFEMNERATHESGLKVSYVLFNLSKVVDPIE